jgi:LCP family protein required for cell wall assembly
MFSQATELTSTPAPKLAWFKIICLSLLLAVGIATLFLAVTGGILGFIGWQKFQKELTTRNLELSPTMDQIEAGWNQTPKTDSDHQNWLILGVDSLSTRGNVPPLTDTMLLGSFDLKNKKINLLSLPRDLWLDDVQTKINALYAYGLEKDPTNPTALVTNTLSSTLNIPIHQVVVISLDQLKTLIDLVGGVKIVIPIGFTDTQFPRTDVDIAVVHDPKLLYETVTFTAGDQVLSGEMSLKYIRSRHSGDSAGTDTARGERQQLVLTSLVSQLTDPQLYKTKPTLALDLWQWYQQNFSSQIGLSELTSLAKPFIYPEIVAPEIIRHQVSIAVVNKKTNQVVEPGVLTNPPVKPTKYQGQWVYIINNLENFQAEIKSKLY